MIPIAAPQWNFLTKPIIWMRHRELIVYAIFGFYFLNKTKSFIDRKNAYHFVEARVYTHDESDFSYRERHNKTDGAVSREKILKFRESVLKERAVREREAMLDAYDYLHGTNLKD